jgi:hypothetical protein
VIPLPSQLPGRLLSRTHGLGARPGNSVHGIDASHNPRSRLVDGGREPTVRNISRSLTPVLRRPYPVPGWRTASTRGRAAHSRQMSWAVATSIHSPRTFTCPRTRKRTNPRAPLICPKTGSTIAVRIAYTAPGCGPRLPVHPLADGEGLRGPATRRRGTGWECFTFSVALDRSVCGATAVPARSLKYPASAERRVGGLPVFSAIAAPMGSRWGPSAGCAVTVAATRM